MEEVESNSDCYNILDLPMSVLLTGLSF